MNKLKSLREKRELSQYDIAKRTGIKLTTIQSWEQGKSDMTQIKVETAYKVAKIFNVNIEFLVGLSCEKLE